MTNPIKSSRRAQHPDEAYVFLGLIPGSCQWQHDRKVGGTGRVIFRIPRTMQWKLSLIDRIHSIPILTRTLNRRRPTVRSISSFILVGVPIELPWWVRPSTAEQWPIPDLCEMDKTRWRTLPRAQVRAEPVRWSETQRCRLIEYEWPTT